MDFGIYECNKDEIKQKAKESFSANFMYSDCVLWEYSRNIGSYDCER